MDVFKRHRYMFRCAGVYFDGELGRFGRAVVEVQRWVTSFLLLYMHSIGFFLGVYTRHSEFPLVPTLVMCCGMVSGPSTLLKHMMLYRRRGQVKELMDQLNGYKVDGGVGTFTKYLMYSYEGMALFFNASSILKNALENPDLTVPYPAWEAYEINTQGKRTLHFFTFYGAIALCWLVTASVDTVVLHLSNQLCHKLAILNNTLGLIGLGEEERESILKKKKVLPLKDYEDKTILKNSLDEHFHLMRLTKSLSQFLNEVFIYQGVNSMAVLLVCFYIFSNSKDLINDTVAFSGALVVVFLQVLTSCWSGELIKIRCEQIHFSLYNNQWYDADPKIKSSLFIMATYTAKPITLRGAYYVFELSLQTYETFIRQAFSFFTVMYQFLD
nr:odorant receptor 64 [Graphosoma rubrolineatum]